jgi:hypothetical protein
MLQMLNSEPVRQLKLAVAGQAANNWRTQLGPELITRRDEFGSLSRCCTAQEKM